MPSTRSQIEADQKRRATERQWVLESLRDAPAPIDEVWKRCNHLQRNQVMQYLTDLRHEGKIKVVGGLNEAYYQRTK